MEPLPIDLGNDADYLAWTRNASDAVKEASAELDRVVIACRRRGLSWERIAGELGITKQAAHQRYSWISFLPSDYGQATEKQS